MYIYKVADSLNFSAIIYSFFKFLSQATQELLFSACSVFMVRFPPAEVMTQSGLAIFCRAIPTPNSKPLLSTKQASSSYQLLNGDHGGHRQRAGQAEQSVALKSFFYT